VIYGADHLGRIASRDERDEVSTELQQGADRVRGRVSHSGQEIESNGKRE
jgi:hypothetical protein